MILIVTEHTDNDKSQQNAWTLENKTGALSFWLKDT